MFKYIFKLYYVYSGSSNHRTFAYCFTETVNLLLKSLGIRAFMTLLTAISLLSSRFFSYLYFTLLTIFHRGKKKINNFEKIRSLAVSICWKDTAENMKGWYLSPLLFEQKQDRFSGSNIFFLPSPSFCIKALKTFRFRAIVLQVTFFQFEWCRVGGPFYKRKYWL